MSLSEMISSALDVDTHDKRIDEQHNGLRVDVNLLDDDDDGDDDGDDDADDENES
jgi:hypothetical protein